MLNYQFWLTLLGKFGLMMLRIRNPTVPFVPALPGAAPGIFRLMGMLVA